MKIGIGNDHAAVDMKNEISEYLKEKGYEVVNYGTDSNESCDYPVYGEKVGEAVAHGDVDLGILICGTGVGISLAAKKVSVQLSAASHIQLNFPDSTIIPTSLHLEQELSVSRQLR